MFWQVVLSILMFIAVVVSLLVAIKSINTTKHIQRIAYKQALLKEIIDWAVDLSQTPTKMSIIGATELEMADKCTPGQVQSIALTNFRMNLKIFDSRNEYIKQLASSSFLDSSLSTAVKSVVDELNSIIEQMDTGFNSREDILKAQKVLEEHFKGDKNLFNLINKLIIEITKSLKNIDVEMQGMSIK